MFHIKKIFVKYLECFNKFSDCLPQYISQSHTNETGKRSDSVESILLKEETDFIEPQLL